MKSFIRTILACLVTLGCISTSNADPQDYSRVVGFGDSLSDNGNLYRNTVGAQPPSPLYNQRFTNGNVWLEYLASDATGRPVPTALNRFYDNSIAFFPLAPYNVSGNVDTGVGGATAGGLNKASGLFVNGGVYILSSEAVNAVPGVLPGGIPSVEQQISTYVANGGKFGARDLVSVQGGANDLFNYFGVIAASPPPPPGQPGLSGLFPQFANQVAGYEIANINAVTVAGAKTVLVSNIPDIGATPAYRTTALATVATQATAIYNASLNTGTQQLAALNPSVNYVQMDWAALFGVVRANPGAFGLTNITQACTTNNVYVNGCSAANVSQFLFWDPVHPTDVAGQYLARYASLLLSTEQTGRAVAALGQTSLSTRLEASDIISRRGTSPFGQNTGLYAEVIGSTGSGDTGSTRLLGGGGYDYSLGGVRAGFDAASGQSSAGVSIAYQSGSLSGGQLKSDLATTQLDAYALTRFASFFVGIEGGVSFNTYDNVKRQTGFPTVRGEGSTGGTDYSVAGTFGTQYTAGAVTLTPAARVGFASVNVDAFSESAPILGLDYRDRDITTGFWTVRLRASSPLTQSGRATVYGEVGYEDLFGTSGSYAAKLVNNTAKAVTIDENLEARGFFVKAGVGGTVWKDVKLQGEYTLALQNGLGDVHSGRLRLTIPLDNRVALPE